MQITLQGAKRRAFPLALAACNDLASPIVLHSVLDLSNNENYQNDDNDDSFNGANFAQSFSSPSKRSKVASPRSAKSKRVLSPKRFERGVVQQSPISLLQQEAIKNWAGGNHWKFKAPRRSRHLGAAEEEEDEGKEHEDNAGASKTKRKTKSKAKKSTFLVDFSFSPSSHVMEKAFAKPKRGSNTIAKTTIAKSALDEDKLSLSHFCSLLFLIALFLVCQISAPKGPPFFCPCLPNPLH